MKIETNELTRKEVEIMKSLGSKPYEAIRVLIKSHLELQQLISRETVLDFIENRIERTSDFKDKITLKEAYDLYCEDMQHKSGKVLGKKEFSKAMEVAGVKRAKASQNKNVFCFVKLKTEEDLEWEL